MAQQKKNCVMTFLVLIFFKMQMYSHKYKKYGNALFNDALNTFHLRI